ncbi:ABC transporter substrate-binding protein [Streptomyces actuosus]|uniref:ABC transporter substrate-binding protein n=2 Tax=Streptomyces actuosus TaxID=1885 RepID=A0ABS2VVK9_STRAS|nr:ABC transporter substrate-binding protein [Streptomyces actuosus]
MTARTLRTPRSPETARTVGAFRSPNDSRNHRTVRIARTDRTAWAGRTVVAALTAFALLALAACGGGSGTATARTTVSGAAPPVRIMVSGLDKQIYLPVLLAQELGYFEAQGVAVTLADVPAGVEAETELLSGQVEAVVGFYDHTIDLQSKGRSVQSVVQLLRAPGEAVMVRDDAAAGIRSPADFAGRRLGVTGLGSSTNFLMRYLAARNGVSARQATSVAVGAGASFVAAMRSKRIDVGMTTEPTISLLEQKGLGGVLVDLRTVADAKAVLGGTYPASCLYLTTAYIRENAATVQKLVNALVEALHWVGSHTADEITDRLPPRYYQDIGKEVYARALEHQKDMYSPTGFMPADGPRTVLKVLSGFDPTVEGHSIDLSRTFTDDFVARAF